MRQTTLLREFNRTVMPIIKERERIEILLGRRKKIYVEDGSEAPRDDMGRPDYHIYVRVNHNWGVEEISDIPF